MRVESEAEVLSRIEETRERIGTTIEEIGERVNPDRVQRRIKARAREQVNEARESVKQKARETMRGIQSEVSDTGRGFWHTIRSNPVPAGLIGVGLAWLVAKREKDEHPRLQRAGRYEYPEAGGYRAPEYDRYGTSGPREPFRGAPPAGPYPGHVYRGEGEAGAGMRERAGEIAETVRGRAEEAAGAVREKAEDVRERASGMAHEAQDRMQHVAHEVTDRARDIEHRAEDVVQDHPVASTMVAAALGFAAGLAIPESHREREIMGHARQRVGERAGQAMHDAGQAAREAARETAGESARRAVDQVLHHEEDEDRGPEPGGPMTDPRGR
ncbi:MAG TPA: DUF3618 domain-containing protein [Longimicrobiales bacterium]|nr:DUF3618 domain-containing protein [Longimicrobiales bacterium]